MKGSAASEHQTFCLPHLNAGEPLSDGGEALLSRDVINHDHAIGFAEKLFGDASIPAAGGRLNVGRGFKIFKLYPD